MVVQEAPARQAAPGRCPATSGAASNGQPRSIRTFEFTHPERVRRFLTTAPESCCLAGNPLGLRRRGPEATWPAIPGESRNPTPQRTVGISNTGPATSRAGCPNTSPASTSPANAATRVPAPGWLPRRSPTALRSAWRGSGTSPWSSNSGCGRPSPATRRSPKRRPLWRQPEPPAAVPRARLQRRQGLEALSRGQGQGLLPRPAPSRRGCAASSPRVGRPLRPAQRRRRLGRRPRMGRSVPAPSVRPCHGCAGLSAVGRSTGRPCHSPMSRAAPAGPYLEIACLCPPSVVPPQALQGRSVPPCGPVLPSLRNGLRPAFPASGTPAPGRRSHRQANPRRSHGVRRRLPAVRARHHR